MSLPTLTLQRYSGELGRALQTVRDWSEGLRAEVMPRLTRQRGGDQSTAIEHARPGEMRITGAGTVVLPAPVQQNRGFLVTLTAESTCTVRTVSGTVGGTYTVTVNSGRDALFVSDGYGAWQAWVRIQNSDDVVNVSTVEGDTVTEALDALASSGVSDHGALTGLADDDHTHYLLASGARTATYLHSANYYSVGASPAASGAYRLTHGAAIRSRAYGGGSDVDLLALSGSGNHLAVGTTTVDTLTQRTSGASQSLSAQALSLSMTTVSEPAARASTTNSVYYFRSGDVLCLGTYYGRCTLAPKRVA